MIAPRLPAGQWVRLSAIGAFGFLGVWTAAALAGLTSREFLPTPWDVAVRFTHLLIEPFAGYTLGVHLLSSMQRFAMGFLLAACMGVPLGLLMAWFRWLDRIITPAFEAIRFVAPIAWVPFAALWFGTGIGGPVLIIFMGAFPPVLILGASHWRVMTQVLLPAAVPSIVAGLRISAGLGWQSLVGAELIVASSGVGYLMVKGQAAISTATVMSGMLAIGFVGVLIDTALRRAHQAVEARRGQ